MSEQELALEFIKAFPDSEIFQEVPAGGRVVDFVAKNGAVVISVEVKKSLNWDVIHQAQSNTGYFHYSYIAVPEPKSLHEIQKKILKDYGIGLMVYRVAPPNLPGYTDKHSIAEPVKPRLFRTVIVPDLMDFMKANVAGTQHGRTTPFGHFVNCVKHILFEQSKPMGYAALFAQLEYKYYPRIETFKSNLYQYIRTGVVKDITWHHGGYLSLTEQGRKEASKIDIMDVYSNELVTQRVQKISNESNPTGEYPVLNNQLL